MAAVTASVVVAGAAVASAAQQRKAAKKQEKAAKEAAAAQERAALESTKFIQEQGIAGEKAIRQSAIDAAGTAEGIPQAAIQPIQRLADLGDVAFRMSARDIIRGTPIMSGARVDVQEAAAQGSFGVPGTEIDPSSPVGRELLRQSAIEGQLAEEAISRARMGLGRQGLSVTGDIAAIEQRGAERLADIASRQAAARSSALVGAAVPATQAIQGAGEARLLSEAAGQRADVQQRQDLARLAGQIVGSFT